MARFNIVSANGQVVRYSGKPKYNGVFGGVSYLEFAQIASPTLIDFHVGDYVDYSRTGFRYKLYSVPKPTKRSGNNTVGDTYVYKNVQFHCATKDAELAPFRDLVLNDNLIHFTTLPTISVYDDVYGIADRIQACMDDYAGTGVWNITVMNTSDPVVLAKLHEEKEFSVSGISCLGALEEIYRLWSGIGWVYSVVNGVNTITLGRPNVQDSGNTTDVFSYGKGNGLTVIAQAVSDKNDMATRLYVYGSDRNLPPRYYNNISPSIFSSESVYIPNLMIPPSLWGTTSGARDARKAYIDDSSAIAEYGLIPKTIYFDGGSDHEEIYPSLEGMTFSQLRSALGPSAPYYPSNIYSGSDPVNVIKSAENPSDNGIIENGGSRFAESSSVNVPAISESANYAENQYVLNASPGGTLASYTVGHTGKMKIDPKGGISVECTDALGVSAVFVVSIGGEAVKIVDLPVTKTRTDFSVEFVPFSLDVTAGNVVTLSLGIEIRLPNDNGGGTAYFTALAFPVDLNVQYVIGESFTMRLKQIGFDIGKQGSSLSNGLATISMKSGFCGGRDFVVKSCTYDSATDDWVVECYRQKDDSLGQYFPNSIYPIAAGDSYVLVDMMMPEVYIQAAEQRLYERGQEELERMSKPSLVYTPEIDAKLLAETPETLIEGMYMPVYDENLIPTTVEAHPHTVWVLINSLVISENESEIPLYKVTLADEKAGSFLQSYTNEMAANARRLRLEAEAEARSPYIPTTEDEGTVPVPYVEINSSADFFTYADGQSTPMESSITLQAIPHDIANPTYQWYYNGSSGWTALSGATGQTYVVDPDSSVYYPSGDNVAEFKVTVSSEGVTYDAFKAIVKLKSSGSTPGADALNVMLSNPARVFGANANGVAYNATDTVYIYAYKGSTRQAATIGTISGAVTGLGVTKMNNGTTSAAIIVTASPSGTSLTQGGSLSIPITVDGTTVTLRYSWSLSPKGDKGDKGDPGTPGAPGAPGPTVIYQFKGVYDSNGYYFGSTTRRDIVKYNDMYYMTKENAGDIRDGVNPASSSKWEVFEGNYTNIATGLIYAEEAVFSILRTTSTGNGQITAEGNALTMFDSQGNPRLKISGDDIASAGLSGSMNVPTTTGSSYRISDDKALAGYDYVYTGTIGTILVASGANMFSIPQISFLNYIRNGTVTSSSIITRAILSILVDGVEVASGVSSWTQHGVGSSAVSNGGSIPATRISLSAGTRTIGYKLTIEVRPESSYSSSSGIDIAAYVSQAATLLLTYSQQITEIGPNGFRAQNAQTGVEVTPSGLKLKIGGTWYTAGTATISGNTVLKLT